MTLKTTPWDSAEHLRTEEDRAAYLTACMDEAPEDAAFITHALGVVARSRNMSQLARDTGLTREGLYKALSENGNPSFGTVLKVVHAMGYRLTVAREKTSTRKTVAKRVVAKCVVTKRAVTKRVVAKCVVTKRAVTKRAVTKRAAGEKSTDKRAVVKPSARAPSRARKTG
jgi:probable addiction module antidote protein